MGGCAGMTLGASQGGSNTLPTLTPSLGGGEGGRVGSLPWSLPGKARIVNAAGTHTLMTRLKEASH